MNKIILGIESSCDDTAVALVNSEGEILSSVISSNLLYIMNLEVFIPNLQLELILNLSCQQFTKH